MVNKIRIIDKVIIDDTRKILVVFLIGVLSHLFIISNNYPNHDSIALTSNNADWLLVQGKWFVTPLTSLDGPINIPYFSAIIGLFAVSLASLVICETMDVRSSVCVITAGACIITFPSVATFMLYQSADYFGLTLLMAAIGTYFIAKSKKLLMSIAGIVILAFSIGAYQAYLGLAVSILLLICIRSVLENKSIVEVIRTGVCYIIHLFSAVMIYYIVLKIKLATNHAELSNYKGINNMEDNLRPGTLFKSIAGAYKDVYAFYLRDCFNINNEIEAPFGIVLSILFVVICIICAKKSGALYHVSLVILAVMCIPAAVNTVGILSANKSFYYISIAPFCMLYLSPLLITESIELQFIDDNTKVSDIADKSMVITRNAIVIILLTLALYSSYQNNAVYYKISLINAEIDSKLISLVTRIQMTEGYVNGMKVAFVGDTPYEFMESSGVLHEAEENFDTIGYGLGNGAGEIYSEGILNAYINNRLSVLIQSSKLAEEEIDTELITNMPTYPSYGSIRKCNDVMVVKLGEYNR